MLILPAIIFILIFHADKFVIVPNFVAIKSGVIYFSAEKYILLWIFRIL